MINIACKLNRKTIQFIEFLLYSMKIEFLKYSFSIEEVSIRSSCMNPNNMTFIAKKKNWNISFNRASI